MKSDRPFYIEISDLTENLISNIQGGVIICQFDPLAGESKIVYMSEGWTKLTGYTKEELESICGGNPQALIIPEDQERAGKSYGEQISKGNCYQLEYRFKHKNGNIIWAIDRGIITATADGFNQNQSIITDITPIKDNEEKLRISEARLRMATKASYATVFEFDSKENSYICIENPEVVFRADSQSVIAAVEQAKSRKVDFSLEDVLEVWYHSADIPVILCAYKELENKGVSECEVRLRQPDGSYIWCKLNQTLVDDMQGDLCHIVGHLVNIDEQHKQTDRLVKEAQTDALTRLMNKSATRLFVEETLNTTPNLCHGLLVLDVDNFKGVNDKLGHLFGDAVLMDVSAKLSRLFRRDSVVGRIGGDEFAVLIRGDLNAETVAQRAEEICKAFRHTYSGEKADYKISCSVGVALTEQGDTYDSLFRKADIALYKAKAQGKDRYVIYQETGQESTTQTNIHQADNTDSGKLKIKERIFELLYGSVDFTSSVNMILSLLGQLLECDRVYIYENFQDNSFSRNIYEWCADGVTPIMADMQDLPVEQLRYFDQFDNNGICRYMNVSTLPLELQKIYEGKDIVSTFQVKLVDDGIVRGFMGYDSLHAPLSQSSETIDIMTFAAKVTGTFIIKKRADESMKLYNQNKMEALDNLPSAIYVIDEEYKLQYMNNLVVSTVLGVQVGEKCYEAFMKNSMPCEECPAKCCKEESCSREIYNPYTDIWMISTATNIKWSGQDNMCLINCQVINQYKKNS